MIILSLKVEKLGMSREQEAAQSPVIQTFKSMSWK